MKFKHLLPLLMVTITSCTQNAFVLNRKVFCFDTLVDITLYEGNEQNAIDIENICVEYSNFSDNYRAVSGVNNIYTINNADGEVIVDPKLFKMIKDTMEIRMVVKYFNPFIGSLAKKWKEAIASGTTLSDEVIVQEKQKILGASITYKDNVVKLNGEAELDFGGIAKGYTLDVIKDYLEEKEIKHYLINAGSSSILLGEKRSADGYFSVGIKDLQKAYLSLKNCVISTSGNTAQGEHIVDPRTGLLANTYDSVIVVSEGGMLGDALSTSMMMCTVEEIQELESSNNVQAIAIKDGQIVYKNSSLKVRYR